MSGLKSRLAKLEAHLRREHPPDQEHCSAVVLVPPDIPYDAWDDWLASQPCACGQLHCPERTIGVVLPTKEEAL
jgi:hypothetical protein